MGGVVVGWLQVLELLCVGAGLAFAGGCMVRGRVPTARLCRHNNALTVLHSLDGGPLHEHGGIERFHS